MADYDDNQSVGGLLKGKSPEEQQRILQGIAEQVVKEHPEIANGVDYDFKTDFKMNVVIDRKAAGAYSDISPPGDEDYCGSKGCLKGNDEIHVDPRLANVLTVKQLKSVYAHELDHVDQLDLPQAGRHNSNVARELDSDRTASEKYGPQTTIDVLEKVARLYPEACDLPKTDPHPSIRRREQAIVEEFPDAHLAVPSPGACPAPKGKQQPAK